MNELPPSPKMSELIVNPDAVPKSKYDLPFQLMLPGDTFTIPITDIQSNTLRVYAARASKKYGTKFVVITHKAEGLHEVGRVKASDEAS